MTKLEENSIKEIIEDWRRELKELQEKGKWETTESPTKQGAMFYWEGAITGGGIILKTLKKPKKKREKK